MANLSDASGTMTINAPNLAILFNILKNHRNEKQDSAFYTKYYTDLLEAKESMSNDDLWTFLTHKVKTSDKGLTVEFQFEAIGQWEYDSNIRNFVLQDLTKNLPDSLFVYLPQSDQYLTGRFEYHDEEPGCGVNCDVITEYTYDLNTRVTKTKDLLYLTH